MTLTVLKSSSGCSSGSDRCSCVTETSTCCVALNTDLRKVTTDKSSFDTVSFVMLYTMRLFNTTIMVLEYIFPSTSKVVSKYDGLLGIKNKMRLMIAKAAVQVENIIRIWRRENNENDFLTSQHPRPNSQARYFLNQPLGLFQTRFPPGKL